MQKNQDVDNVQSERLSKTMPSINSLLKISIGLIIVTIISSAFVYAETASVSVGGTSYDVRYTENGVSVSGIEADAESVSLLLTVNVTGSSGTLDVVLERNFFDSVYQGKDDSFIILADGVEPIYSEIETTPQSRTLSMQLPAGTEEVEIIGSIFGQSSSVPTPVKEEPTPVKEEPTPVKEEPTPVKEEPTPVKEEPTPVKEEPTPVKEEPTPVKEEPTPVKEEPKTECGTGTILKDGVCVLDERCGSGTILQDGVCIVESTPATTTVKGLGSELIYGSVAAFVIAGIVGLVLALMSKASKSKDH